eukprot:Mrub_05457.p1 GENE.Mrub_05457~~Mrub_05457.p1  ORF type:complete len:345 (+),score=58.84 Mrub_05457:31-1035(+)
MENQPEKPLPLEEHEFIIKYSNNPYYQQKYPGFYLQRGFLCYSIIIIFCSIVVSGGVLIMQQIPTLFFNKLPIDPSCSRDCYVSFNTDRDLTNVQLNTQININQVLRRYITSLVYYSFDGNYIPESDYYTLNKNCISMQTVRDAKTYLRASVFKNLNGDDLQDEEILYPCGYTSISYLLSDKLVLKKVNEDGTEIAVEINEKSENINLKGLIDDKFTNNEKQAELSYVDYEDPHYINWVSLNYNSVKLYAKVPTLERGEYRVYIKPVYEWVDSDKSHWRRHVIVQEVTWFGNKNQFIHYVGFALAGLALVLVVVDAVPGMKANQEYRALDEKKK